MKEPYLLNNPASLERGGLLKTGFFSLLLHVVLIALLTFNLKSPIPKGGPSVYRVTIRPYTPLGAIQSSKPGGGLGGASTSLMAEQMKLDESSKGSKVGGKSKPERPRRDEMGTDIKSLSEKGGKPKAEKESTKSLQEALEDIRKKVALDKIQKRVADRERVKEQKTTGQLETRQITESQALSDSSQSQTGSSSRAGSGSGVGTGIGTGSGSGIGSGVGGYPIGGVPWGSPQGSSAWNSKLDDYYNMIWAKIKKEWTLPEDLPKAKTDLESIIVVIIKRDGKIQKLWFEKRSGNSLYDQRAMRAVKKAEPLPPIPKEFSDDTFEIGIRFHPD